jgi:hypothetical protein
MRHYIRNLEGQVWDITKGWHDLDEDTTYFGSDSYISLELSLKHYFDNYLDDVLRFPIFNNCVGIHVFVTLEEC